ncbi:uncharacterized protein N0V89_002793 [Didymosphaeria variabile]|uniref:Tyrosinase copper-binding domain-containing protein n=1 Tax=Didymosphaeria variabile TaxID=1932322 RepID=A0A9W8XU64_9PLEO|nr:uncharacterized protein N0V89_002793 [Didymosphaeria variabile]KAJ4358213.1 hypothetical protein N0V89_002793 [Didymosphaeria variabile]
MAGHAVISLLTALCLFSSASAFPFLKRQSLSIDDIQKQALNNAYKVLDGTLSDGITRTSTCNKNTVLRSGDLVKEEKLEYIRAVNCIRKQPSKLPAGKFPGAKSRYDDFVVVHMNMTPSVHSTANFMHWHRYYIWCVPSSLPLTLLHINTSTCHGLADVDGNRAYETALKTECSFNGAQPYWNWGKYTDLPQSPIFDGGETSLGGNGDYVQHAGGLMGRPFPAGNGGGCVTKGPLGNLTISLGPLMNTMDPKLNIKPNPSRDGYGDNTRCLRRDVNNNLVTVSLTPTELASHITSNSAIGKFQDTVQNDQGSKMAIHSSGHYSIFGDPGGDIFVSPGEPVFWLHHGQLDRHWWMWANYLADQVKARTSMYEGKSLSS